MTRPLTAALVLALLAAGCAPGSGPAAPGGPAIAIRIVNGIEGLEKEELPPFEAKTGETPSLTVDAEGASVEVAGREGTGITVRATRYAETKAELGRVAIAFDRDDDGNVTVRQTVAKDADRSRRFQAAIVVEAPRGVRVSVRNAAGSVRLASVATAAVRSGGGSVKAADASGLLDLQTAAGSVTVERAGGDVRVRTGGGAIRVVGAAGEVSLDSSAGSVTVEGAKAAVKVHTGGGTITVKDPAGALDLDSSAGSLTVENAPGPVRARTGGGTIRIAGTPGELDLESSAGSIRVEDADGRVRVETGGGTIHLAGRLRGGSRARSAAGSIEVTIAGGVPLVVKARSAVGTLRGPDGPLRFQPGEAPRATWTLGDGSAGTLDLETGGGSITVERK